MSDEYLTRREFLLGKFRESPSPGQQYSKLLLRKYEPTDGCKWSIDDDVLNVERRGAQLVCRKRISEIELCGLEMMDGSMSLEEIIAEISDYIDSDRNTAKWEILNFARWALKNGIIKASDASIFE